MFLFSLLVVVWYWYWLSGHTETAAKAKAGHWTSSDRPSPSSTNTHRNSFSSLSSSKSVYVSFTFCFLFMHSRPSFSIKQLMITDVWLINRPSGKKGQSFLEMIKSAKDSADDDNLDDEEKFVLKKETPSPIHKGLFHMLAFYCYRIIPQKFWIRLKFFYWLTT